MTTALKITTPLRDEAAIEKNKTAHLAKKGSGESLPQSNVPQEGNTGGTGGGTEGGKEGGGHYGALTGLKSELSSITEEAQLNYEDTNLSPILGKFGTSLSLAFEKHLN